MSIPDRHKTGGILRNSPVIRGRSRKNFCSELIAAYKFVYSTRKLGSIYVIC